MKFNQIWYGVSSTTAVAAGVACLIRGYNTLGAILLVIGVIEYLIAAYVFKIFRTKWF